MRISLFGECGELGTVAESEKLKFVLEQLHQRAEESEKRRDGCIRCRGECIYDVSAASEDADGEDAGDGAASAEEG